MRLGLLVFFVLALPAYSAPLEKLSIMVEDGAGPWSNMDGTGVANDLVKAAFEAQGVAVELVVVPYARCKLSVIKGDVAGCFSMSYSAEFEGVVKFSAEPLFVCRADFYRNNKGPLKAKSLTEVPAGTVVGTVTGYEYPPETELLRKKGVVFEESASEETNLKKLASGRIAAVILNGNKLKPLRGLLERTGTIGAVGFAFKGGELRSFIGFSLRHARGEWARKAFDQGYAKIRRSGRAAQIERQWLSTLSR